MRFLIENNDEFLDLEVCVYHGFRYETNCHRRDTLKKVIFAPDVKMIHEGAFAFCENLTHVEIPEGVKYIGPKAFIGCSNLKSVILPSTLISIYELAFEGCYNLHSIKIPSNVSHIGRCAFSGCSGLFDLELPVNTTIEDKAFQGCNLPQNQRADIMKRYITSNK